MARPGAEEAYGIYAGIITPFGRFLMCLRYEDGADVWRPETICEQIGKGRSAVQIYI